MNHREINNELYSNTEDNEIYIKEGGDKIEQQLNGQKKYAIRGLCQCHYSDDMVVEIALEQFLDRRTDLLYRSGRIRHIQNDFSFDVSGYARKHNFHDFNKRCNTFYGIRLLRRNCKTRRRRFFSPYNGICECDVKRVYGIQNRRTYFRHEREIVFRCRSGSRKRNSMVYGSGANTFDNIRENLI